MSTKMCFFRTKMYKACGHTEFRRFMCNPEPTKNDSHQPDLDSDDLVSLKRNFACGEQPEYVNDLELGVCGHCRKGRHPNKGVGRRSGVIEKEQKRKVPGIQIFLGDSDASEPKHEKGPEQPMVQTFSPDRCIDETENDEETENVDMVPADTVEESVSFKAGIKEMIEECRQMRDEYQAAQSQISCMLNALNNQGEHPPVGIGNKPELSATRIEPKNPAQPQHAEQVVTHPLSSPSSTRHLSHSVTKVRRDLNAAKGRVRSMIQAINSKGEAGCVISSLNHRSMATSIVNTINRQSNSQYPTKPEAHVVPKKTESPGWALPPAPYSDTRALSKSEKLQVLARHRFHRMVPIPEEYDSKSLVLAKSGPNTVVLRRAKAIQVRNLNAFHCPVRKPRFGLKRTVLAPPVPRHLTPPVAVPCSKFADLGRRRVSELEWCFVI